MMRTLTVGVALSLLLSTAPRAGTTAPSQDTAPPPPPVTAPVVSATLVTQTMLDRAGFSPGEIDDRQGSNLKRALDAFRAAEGIRAVGAMDQQTLARLTERSGNQPALVAYVITDADIGGPFAPEIPRDLVEQSKLQALGYRTPLEALGERVHASPALLKKLNPHATFMTPGETISVPNVAATVPAAPGAATVTVTKATSALTVEDESGRVVFHAPVTSGSQHDPLPIGTWKVTGVQQNPPFNYNPALFWDANPVHSKAKLPPGPNNPVGTVWIDISKEHYGIHGTPEPSQIGHTASHGCVRLTNWDAQHVAAMVKPGTKVVFR